MTAGEYTGSYESKDAVLIQEILSQLNEKRPDMDAALFDRDGDGCVDNLLVIPLLYGNKGNFSSHAGSAPGASAGTKAIGHYTVVDGGVSGIGDCFDASVSAHEYLHTLGAADLYRYAADGEPVWKWDIMAKGSTWNWPLAVTRKTLGWITIPSVDLKNLQESYTLSAPSAGNASGNGGQQALKIQLPGSSTEYFVVEYRQRKPSYPSLLFDDNVDSSGLIIYRVNENLRDLGNKNGGTAEGEDFVYIFRPGETGLKDAAGEFTKAALSAGSFTTQNGIAYNSSFCS